MIEWTSNLPKNGDKRIRKKFCILPRRCQQDRIVWLDHIYLFQQFYEKTYSDQWYRGNWNTHATLSPSQYKRFSEEIALNITDPREKIREFAEIILKTQKKEGK